MLACVSPNEGSGSGGGTAFALTDHACRYCAGRVVQSGDQFRCAGCGVVTMGRPDEICGCGILAGSHNRLAGARFRCIPNPTKSPDNPSEIVIEFFGQVRAAA